MKNLLIIDLESTCYKRGEEPKNFISEIIEIGAVVLDPRTFEIIDEYQAFIKPVIFPKLTDFCKELTTITQEQVDAGKNVEIAMKEINAFQQKHSAVFVSWGFYDKKQFKNVCNHFNISYPFDNKHISIKHEHGTLHNKRPMGMGKALKKHNIPLDGTHHRGIDDARNISKIATVMIKNNWTHKDLQ